VPEARQPAGEHLRLKNSVKAIVVEGGRLLVLKKKGVDRPFYVLPGGTQRPGETLADALVREVREEVGAAVKVGDLKHVRDYIARHHEFAREQAGLHRVEFWFECRLLERPGTVLQTEPDRRQVGVEWLAVQDLAACPLYPRALKDILLGERKDAPVYLGDVN
jgi:ADP-ribose pyrophosphatase YjhB (NUDIX family)